MNKLEQIINGDNCIGCQHNSGGRWSGFSCAIGSPGGLDDYSCKSIDPDADFWDQWIDGNESLIEGLLR